MTDSSVVGDGVENVECSHIREGRGSFIDEAEGGFLLLFVAMRCFEGTPLT